MPVQILVRQRLSEMSERPSNRPVIGTLRISKGEVEAFVLRGAVSL
jgi:hypothetical protein